MANVKGPKGRYEKVAQGHTIPYGTMVGASKELHWTYYYYGYRHDEDMPPLPCPPPDMDEPYICAEEEFFKKELAVVLNEMLDSLTPRRAKVLRLRWGLDSGVERTLDEVGYAFRVTKERIRQIEARALRDLKRPSRWDILHKLLWPRCTEDDLIEVKKSERLHKEWQRRQKEAAEARYQKNKKAGLVYRETDTSWLDHVKRVEPELYELVMARTNEFLKKYEPVKGQHG